jgi:hypothetical protein
MPNNMVALGWDRSLRAMKMTEMQTTRDPMLRRINCLSPIQLMFAITVTYNLFVLNSLQNANPSRAYGRGDCRNL